MLQFDEYRVKLNNLKPDLDELGKALDLESAERELDELRAQSAADGFWDNVEKARKVQKRISNLEDKVNAQAKRESAWDDLMTLCEMGNEEEDASLIPEVESGYDALIKEMETARLSTLLSGEYDNSTAIVSLQAGAGGTEAQDWAQMLYRMGRSATAFPILCWIIRMETRRASSPPPSALRETTPTAISRASTASTAWCVSPPLTLTPGGRPPSPPWRSCRRSTTA